MPTRKEKAWLAEYFRCGFNATEAARRAGYKWPDRIGTRKLKKFDDAIQRHLGELAMSADEVLVRLSEIARGEHSKYIRTNGTVDIERMLYDNKGHLITKVYETQYGRRVEFCNMQSALVDVGKAQGLFTTRVDVTSLGRSIVADERQRVLADAEKKMEVVDSRATANLHSEPD